MDFPSFESLATSLPLLSKLTVDLISWKYEPGCETENQISETRELHLSSVEFKRYSEPSMFAAWLLKMPSFSSLQKVAFDWVMSQDAKAVGSLLQHLGPSLRDLRIGCRFDEHPEISNALNEYIDLAHNPELRSLHLTVYDLQDHLTPWIPAILFQASRAPLTKITIELWLHSPHQLTGPAWDNIAETLSNRAFAKVQEVAFMHRGDLSMKATTKALKERFHALEKRHVLAIQNRSAFLVHGSEIS